MSLNHLIDPQIALGARIPYTISVAGLSADDIKSESVQTRFLNMNSAAGTVRFAIQVPPATNVGDVGDEAGDVILGNDGYLYVCFGAYDGITPIWQRVQLATW